MERLGSWGIPFLDVNLTGICSGDLIMFAAMSGSGKTTFANTIAKTATEQDIPTSLFSLENAKGDFLRQAVFTEYKSANPQDKNNYRQFLTDFSRNPTKYEKYTTCLDELFGKLSGGDVPMFSLIESTDGVQDLKTLLREVEKYISIGKKLIIIDHIDHVSNDQTADLQFIRYAMKQLANLAFQKNVCIITFSQIRKDLPATCLIPGMYDLKGGSQKADVATIVITLARDPFFDTEERKATLMAIRKDRYGHLAMGRLFWCNGKYERYFKEIKDFDASGYVVDGLNKQQLLKASKQFEIGEYSEVD